MVEEAKAELDSLADVDPSVSAAVHYVSSLYYKVRCTPDDDFMVIEWGCAAVCCLQRLWKVPQICSVQHEQQHCWWMCWASSCLITVMQFVVRQQ